MKTYTRQRTVTDSNGNTGIMETNIAVGANWDLGIENSHGVTVAIIHTGIVMQRTADEFSLKETYIELENKAEAQFQGYNEAKFDYSALTNDGFNLVT